MKAYRSGRGKNSREGVPGGTTRKPRRLSLRDRPLRTFCVLVLMGFAVVAEALQGGDREVTVSTAGETDVAQSTTVATEPPVAQSTAVGTQPPDVGTDTSSHSPPDCPDPGQPGGPGSVSYFYSDAAVGSGDATPEAALEGYLADAYPTAPRDFQLTGRNPRKARFENDAAVLLVSLIPDVGWTVDSGAICRPKTVSWFGSRP